MKQYGFSLIELVISLSIITVTCLLLLKQQWQAILWSNHQSLNWQVNQHLFNACEFQKAKLPPPPLPEPFQWQSSDNLRIKWNFHQQTIEDHFHCSKPLRK